MFLSETVRRVEVFVSSFGITGPMVSNGMPCGGLLKRLEEVLAVYEIYNKAGSGRGNRSFSVFVSGAISCQNRMGESDLICHLMRRWLIRNKISEHCIYTDFLSLNAESGIRAFRKRLQNVNMDRTAVCIVSQTYHAIYLQQLLNFISQGRCLSMIRCCRYGSRSILSGMFALFQYCME